LFFDFDLDFGSQTKNPFPINFIFEGIFPIIILKVFQDRKNQNLHLIHQQVE